MSAEHTKAKDEEWRALVFEIQEQYADAMEEIAALRAQLAEAERERDERGTRIVIGGERFDRLAAAHATTKAALDEAVGLFSEGVRLSGPSDGWSAWWLRVAEFITAHAAKAEEGGK